jgi:beta-phosphoglucomutase-like phosphatase (HAD superfamily)
VTRGAELSDIVGGGPLLLDFDGPICSIFAGYPAPQVAAELIAKLREVGAEPPAEVAAYDDPLAVLQWTGEVCPPEVTVAIEDVLCAAELRAVVSAAPTPYGRDVIVSARQAGLPVAVVSNNSTAAVATYLTAQGVAEHVSPVVGRAYGEPWRMKPNPEPILTAVRTLGVEPAACVLIGDSLTDIDGARAAGVRVIGYANRPGKLDAFRGADAVITSMGALVTAIGHWHARSADVRGIRGGERP